MRFQKKYGYFFTLFGAIVVLSTYSGMTGNVTAEQGSLNFLSILGIFMLVGGLVLITAVKMQVVLYEQNQVDSDKKYFLKDKLGFFNKGDKPVEWNEVKKKIAELKKDRKKYEKVKLVYVKILREKYFSNESSRKEKEVALEFLSLFETEVKENKIDYY